MKKICVVTGSRADYGLLRWVMEGIQQSSELELQIIATGTHLSPEFGLTIRAIEQDGFPVAERVEMLLFFVYLPILKQIILKESSACPGIGLFIEIIIY